MTKIHPAIKIIAINLGVVFVVGFIIYNFTFVGGFFKPNYAKELAKPIEEALVDAGARKVCESGDNGRGPDNTNPWYVIYFQINETQDETVSIINSMKLNNYRFEENLSQDFNRKSNRFLEEVSDQKHGFKDLEDGTVEMSFSIYAKSRFEKEEFNICGVTDDENADPNKTIFRIDLGLPDFKI